MSGRYFFVRLLYSLNARRGFGLHLHTITDLHIILPDTASVNIFLLKFCKFFFLKFCMFMRVFMHSHVSPRYRILTSFPPQIVVVLYIHHLIFSPSLILVGKSDHRQSVCRSGRSRCAAVTRCQNIPDVFRLNLSAANPDQCTGNNANHII